MRFHEQRRVLRSVATSGSCLTYLLYWPIRESLPFRVVEQCFLLVQYIQVVLQPCTVASCRLSVKLVAHCSQRDRRALNYELLVPLPKGCVPHLHVTENIAPHYLYKGSSLGMAACRSGLRSLVLSHSFNSGHSRQCCFRMEPRGSPIEGSSSSEARHVQMKDTRFWSMSLERLVWVEEEFDD